MWIFFDDFDLFCAFCLEVGKLLIFVCLRRGVKLRDMCRSRRKRRIVVRVGGVG